MCIRDSPKQISRQRSKRFSLPPKHFAAMTQGCAGVQGHAGAHHRDAEARGRAGGRRQVQGCAIRCETDV
eukprot:3201877-Rhodomonas_salina.1